MATVGPLRIYILVSFDVELNQSWLLDVQVMYGPSFFNQW
jgi:hypothetical protein